MEIGAVIPHHEIGTDPGAVRAFAQGAEELGMTHLLVYDHVVGVDRNRPGGFEGPYDSNTARAASVTRSRRRASGGRMSRVPRGGTTAACVPSGAGATGRTSGRTPSRRPGGTRT